MNTFSLFVRIVESSTDTETETTSESSSEENGTNDRRRARMSKHSKMSGEYRIVLCFLHVSIELPHILKNCIVAHLEQPSIH